MTRARRSGDTGGPSERGTHVLSALSYREILIGEIIQGLGELRRSAIGLLISGFSAGLDVGFSVLVMGTAITLMDDVYPEPTRRLIVANLYAVGFLFVVLGRSELFTEHTTLAVFPVLAGRATVRTLARLWALVYTANVAGALVFAALISVLGPRLGIIEPEAFGQIALPLLRHPWWVIVLSGLVAGWLMGLLSWLVVAARETISQIFFVWLVTACIGLARLHHSILGTAEVGSAMFSLGSIGAGDFAHFLVFSTIGNVLGGGIFVGVIKYGHAIRGGEAEPEAVADEELQDGGAAAEPPADDEAASEIEERAEVRAGE